MTRIEPNNKKLINATNIKVMLVAGYPPHICEQFTKSKYAVLEQIVKRNWEKEILLER